MASSGNTERGKQYEVLDQQSPPPYTQVPQGQQQAPMPPPNFTSSPYNYGYDQPQDVNVPKTYNTGQVPPQMHPNPYATGYDQPPRPMSPCQPMQPIQTQTTNVVLLLCYFVFLVALAVSQVTQPTGVVTFVQPVRPTNWVVPAVLVCFFCFWPTGICAIIAAFMAESSADNGNMEEAKKTANVAKWLIVVSLILPWVVIGILCIVYFA